jgi:hypothetical protein
VAVGEKYIPQFINVDLHDSLLPNNAARFIKNLVYSLDDTVSATTDKSGSTGVLKTFQSTQQYLSNLVLPEGENTVIGTCTVPETKEILVLVHNSLSNHIIYRINGSDRTYDVVYNRADLNFILRPENFVHSGGAHVEVIYVTDPVTEKKLRRTFLMYTDGDNYQRFICIEDSIATNGFDPVLFPIFQGNYDKTIMINMGVPTPNDCIGIEEIPITEETKGIANHLIYNTWQFRIRNVDVWGRPSEHGIISDLYIPGGSDCIVSSSGISRCVELSFDVPPAYINTIDVEYRNCNDNQWYRSDTLNLFVGAPFADWWNRPRNPKVTIVGNKITYRFCADRECLPVDPNETSRLYNPIPRSSQALTKIGKFIGLGNNKDGFMPFSDALKDNITIDVQAPDDQLANTSNLRNITILCEIYSPFFTKPGPNGINKWANSPIFRMKISGSEPEAYGWGSFGAEGGDQNKQRGFFAYRQFFKNLNQKGFRGYLAGTQNSTISTQWVLDTRSGSFTEVVDYVNPSLNNDEKEFLRFYQMFTFSNINKGKYVFRIASQQEDSDDPSVFTKTSTAVIGLYPFSFTRRPDPIVRNLINHNKELIIDVCEKDYDTRQANEILTIMDFNKAEHVVNDGYVYNTSAIDSQRGIELGFVNGGELNSYYTDHNGYFWVTGQVKNGNVLGAKQYNFDVFAYCSCKLLRLVNDNSGQTHQRFTVNHYLNQNTVCPDYENQKCNYITIKGKVVLCNSGIPVPNVSVVLTRGGTAVTNSDGEFTIIATDDARQPSRADQVFFMSGGCILTDCNGECIDDLQVLILKCTSCTERSLDLPNLEVMFRSERGLLSGGTYGIGVVGWDWLGRPTFVQPLKTLTLPSTQKTKLFSPSKIKITVSPLAVFPVETDYITFWITAETSMQEYITWIADDVQFVDNAGRENNLSPTQIKIYYGSLLEYSKQNNYNTTAAWSFIPVNETTPVLTDKVEFLLNGNGQFFDRSITSLVKYDQTGQYFLVKYTDDLKDLKKNAVMRLIRPKDCVTTEPYYEICSRIKVVNRTAVSQPFLLNAWDTYYVTRQIPVPIPQPDKLSPSGESIPVDPLIEIRPIGVPFESPSPSDFWGYRCHNIGRINVLNPFETILYHEEQIGLSGALSNNGRLNYLNYFDDNKKTDFDESGINGIVAMLPETGSVFVLGQDGYFVVGFNDNLVRINDNGTASAGSIANSFGQPQTNMTSKYGCKLFDKNTVYKHKGLVHYLDTNEGALMQNNYAVSEPISDNGGASHVRPKIKDVQKYNLSHNDSRYFIGLVNPVSNEYILTDRILRSTEYVNELREFNVKVPETISFGIFSKAFKATWGFVPQYYAELEGELEDKQFFSFIDGKPYIHSSVNNNSDYGKIYGVTCLPVVTVSVVIDNMKKKKPLALGVFCKQSQYFSDKVTTETGQLSRILLDHFLQADFGWYAPFLCDLNTPLDSNIQNIQAEHLIFDGNTLTGNYILVRVVGNPAEATKYSELQGLTVSTFGTGNNLIGQ